MRPCACPPLLRRHRYLPAGRVLLLALPWALLSAAPLSACPARCECVPQVRSVLCQRRRLTALPEGIPTETRVLELSRNRLRCLTAGELSAFPLLEELDLSENALAGLEPGAFGGLPQLRALRLRGNQLRLLPAGLFAGLANLTLLDLSENRLVVLVEPRALFGLRQIRLLNLSANFLPTLEEAAFHSVNSLETLRLDRNPLVCDCRLLWVLQRRKTLDFDGQLPTCSSPPGIPGDALRALPDAVLFEFFTCQRPRIRERRLQRVTALEGQPVSFLCPLGIQLTASRARSAVWLKRIQSLRSRVQF
uniref:LRRNT domain-containing protein n=1 Tax=Anolis carolinensis TaxID=28377 RepID=A0A803TBI7_ANOCA